MVRRTIAESYKTVKVGIEPHQLPLLTLMEKEAFNPSMIFKTLVAAFTVLN